MRRIAVVVLALAVLGGTGAAVAVAKAPGKGKARSAKVLQHRGPLGVAADYLGLTPMALARELRGGKSLAQVATAKGKSVDGLEQALLSAFRAKVEAAKAAGRINATLADRLVAGAAQVVDRLVNAAPKAPGAKAGGGKVAQGGLLKTAADYLELTPKALAGELLAGKSLAQVATAKGKSVDGLEQALFAALKRDVDAAVAADRLDAGRAQRLLDRAKAQIERFVNHSR